MKGYITQLKTNVWFTWIFSESISVRLLPGSNIWHQSYIPCHTVFSLSAHCIIHASIPMARSQRGKWHWNNASNGGFKMANGMNHVIKTRLGQMRRLWSVRSSQDSHMVQGFGCQAGHVSLLMGQLAGSKSNDLIQAVAKGCDSSSDVVTDIRAPLY